MHSPPRFGRASAALRVLGLAACGALAAIPAAAQFSNATPALGHAAAAPTGNQPVTFEADAVSYDRDHALVSADGHVQAWQDDYFLSADRVTFDRNRDLAAAYGHVVMVQPDGQIVFAEYAELSQGMKNGVLKAMRALLPENGRMAANGMRRTDAKLNELSRAVYSTCNVCVKHPDRAPLWQLRASHVTQDLEHKRIEYHDAWLDFAGLPILYLPYFSHADPSVHRQSGFLVPGFGITDSHLGSFITVPYFWVLDAQSDVTLTPLIGSRNGPQLQADYRRDFNFGQLRIDGAIANDVGSAQGYLFAHGLFSYDDTWRYGFDLNVARSSDYLRDFRITGFGANVLSSNVFAEGFGVGSYARLDAHAYQGLNSSINQSQLPYVLPRYTYSFFGQPDALGGRLSFDTQSFNIYRQIGTHDQQVGARLNYDLPFAGPLGDRWLFTAQATGHAFNATGLTAQPNFAESDAASGVEIHPQAALRLNWPWLRDAGSLGTQILEPIVQLIASPNTGNNPRRAGPNEDSLDYEFTDSTLFSLNRFSGYDRQDGGQRANFALHGSWGFKGGQTLDAIVGASWQSHIERSLYPQFQPWNGFAAGQRLSDVVGRVSFVPNSWLDFTARGRADHNNGDVRFADGVISLGKPILRMSAGYVFSPIDPYTLYLTNFTQPGVLVPPAGTAARSAFFTPRQEGEAGLSTHFGHWSLAGNARRDLQTGRLVSLGADGKYEDECYVFNILASRRFTSINFDHGDTTVLFTMTFKTVGSVGFNG